ncbi:hypothetical protein A1D22_09475 [Pasteurellaceae bacterium LFhippo2]|nr:hypothetical protein [Pasteurellaceae bacterium LFhippo2]
MLGTFSFIFLAMVVLIGAVVFGGVLLTLAVAFIGLIAPLIVPLLTAVLVLLVIAFFINDFVLAFCILGGIIAFIWFFADDEFVKAELEKKEQLKKH